MTEGRRHQNNGKRYTQRVLQLSRILYKSALFMQNKANLLDALMNVSSIITKDYENETAFALPENKPKQSQCQNRQNEHKHSSNKGLRQRTTNNQQRTLFKTNPNKANFKGKKKYSRCSVGDCVITILFYKRLIYERLEQSLTIYIYSVAKTFFEYTSSRI